MVLMFSPASENGMRLLVWACTGLPVHFPCGRKHSVMAKMRAAKQSQGENQPL